MEHLLKRHPRSVGASNQRISASIFRQAGTQIILKFEVSGDVDKLHIPPFDKIRSGDKLWESTCFEMFVRSTSRSAYCECNFAPGGEWAAYRFDDYRAGMQTQKGLEVASMDTKTGPDRFSLSLKIDLTPVSLLSVAETWWVGLSAILQETGGAKSYWALTHPSEDPDFHHSDCFVVELGAEEPS